MVMPSTTAHDGRGQGGCLKFCDDEFSTIAKGETAQTDVPGAVVVASVDWHAGVPTATVAMWAVGRAASLPGAASGPTLPASD